jgi:probable HAF family extracellular repeat protein
MATAKGERTASPRPWYANRDLAGLAIVSLGAVSAIAVLSFMPRSAPQQVQTVAVPSPGPAQTVLIDPPPEPTPAPAPLDLPPQVTPRSPVSATLARVAVTALTLNVRGGSGVIAGITPDGTAYGRLTRQKGSASDGQLVRWDAAPGRTSSQPRPVPLPRSGGGQWDGPVVSANGVVAWTGTDRGTQSGSTPVALVRGRLVQDRTTLVGQVLGSNSSGKVLLAQTSKDAISASNGKAPWMAYVWDPATGVRQRVPEPGRRILDDGSVLIVRPIPWSDAPRANLVWHDETLTELDEPTGWTARVFGGSGFDAVTGTVIRGADGDPERDLTHAALWRKGQLELLPGLGGRTAVAADANGAGVAVGAAQRPGGQPHAMRWENRRGTDLGTLGGQRSWAVDISDAGVVVGWSTTRDGVQHAAAWLPDGRIVDLGARLGQATESSAQGVSGNRIYGSRTGPGDSLIPVVWTINGL